MKEIMKKAEAFVKKNYIECIVAAAIILVIGASLLIIKMMNISRNQMDVSSSNNTLYQYFNNNKKEFTAKLSYENDALVNIKADNYNVYENSPIYDNLQTQIILPKESSIIFYHRQNLSYRLPKYSSLTLKDGASVVNSKGKEKADSDFFIYDGEDTYLFPMTTTLKINNDAITLSKYSYVIAGSNYITYYDYELDTCMTIENINKAVIVADTLSIDLLKDATVLNSKVGLLNNKVSNLDIYLED